jgi:NADPH:quinone reductase-like Zn-dependent oxidoreductase
MARRGCQWDSGCSAPRTELATAPWPSTRAVEARNLAPLPGDVDFTVGASLPISGLTAWQGLFQHGRLQAGQSVLAHGAAGAVGSMVTRLAREAGAHVIQVSIARCLLYSLPIKSEG